MNRFNVGGPIYNAAYLTKYINRDKYDTLLIGGRHEIHEESAKYILENEKINFTEIKSMRRAISPIYDCFSFIRILLIIYRFKPDIIHTHAAKSGLLGRFAALFYYKKIKIVHTYHGNVFEGYFSGFTNKLILKLERFLASKSNIIVAISKKQKHDLAKKYFICDENKIKIVPLGFDLNKFSDDLENKRMTIRNEYDIKNEVLISIIGRVVPIKNHQFFIDVIKYCKEKTNIPIKALIIGDGPQTQDLIKYTNKIGLKSNYIVNENPYDIFFCSWKKEIDYFLAASDIVALTSLNEGTPVSIIESMASGTASISTDVGGVSDILENRIHGVISNNTVEDFGDDMIELINNKKFRDNLAVNGKNRSFKLFNYNVLINNMENLYQSLSLNE